MGDFAAALAEAQKWVGDIPGVVMVGEGRAADGSPTIDVWVSKKVAVPQAVGGVPVRVVYSGEIEAQ